MTHTEVTIVGAGVVGLTAARVLEEAGCDVSVLADGGFARTTSAAAGAVWFPYRAEPPELVNRWARDSYGWLDNLAREGDGGVVGTLPTLRPGKLYTTVFFASNPSDPFKTDNCCLTPSPSCEIVGPSHSESRRIE